MKRLRTGFTLAEVLITLAIIGVVAAIVIPSVMSSYQYKSVGVKLAKFMATVEGSTRPFIVNNDNFSKAADVTDFLNESFAFKAFDPETTTAKDDEGKNLKILAYPTVQESKLSSDTYAAQSGNENTPIGYLKDGTAIQVYMDSTDFTGDREEIVAPEKYGKPVFRINFDPKVQGLPATARKNYNFTVTELGYVFPSENDACSWQLFNEGYTTNAKSFASGKSCHVAESVEDEE